MSTDWEEQWEVISIAGEGGQGVVKKVHHKQTGEVGALKDNAGADITNSERRRRMVREVESLLKIDNGGVPKILDHNITYVENKNVLLWFITEWVEGKTLRQHTQDKPQSIETSLSIVRDLALILEVCHRNGIHHRDIKPDNIIVQERESQLSVYLVDFGIAYSMEEGNKPITEIGQELGNRFFRLPDFAAGSESRDARSDVTLLVGILFYLLTGLTPRVLVNKHLEPPHIALASRIPPLLVQDQRWRSLQRVFTVGFQPDINLRFQSVGELLQRIDEILFPNQETAIDNSLTLALERYQELVNSAIAQNQQRIQAAMRYSSFQLIEALTSTARQYNLCTLQVAGGPRFSDSMREIQAHYILVRCDLPVPEAKMIHMMELMPPTFSRIRVYYHVGAQTTTYYEGPAADIERLNEEVMLQVQPIFAATLEELSNLINKTIG